MSCFKTGERLSLKKVFAFFDSDMLQWRKRQPCLNPARRVFIAEIWASTTMTRRYRRAPRGQCLDGAAPPGRRGEVNGDFGLMVWFGLAGFWTT
jgi:hypothetical protein